LFQIRPYQLFRLFDAPANGRDVHVQVPYRRGYGSLTLLETMALLASLKAVQAKTVFEFGTFVGGTTLNIALNIPADGRVFTLDLEDEAAIDQHVEDARITTTRRAAPALDFKDSAVEAKITELKGDSTKFDFSPWAGSIDFIFIDGGHDLETVRSDTMNAFSLAKKTGPSAVLWHDYHNKDYADLSEFLDDLSTDRPIFHIGDTMICAWFNDPSNQLVGRLQE
jgi:hypothetical protein